MRSRREGDWPRADLRVTNGGLDANWMVKHGIPTVTFGAGQNEIHTVKEWVDLPEFEAGCNWPWNWRPPLLRTSDLNGRHVVVAI